MSSTTRHCLAFIALALLLTASPALAAGFTKGTAVAPFTPAFKPGDYIWHPEISPAGPVALIVSLPDQVMYVYRNGIRIGRSTVSTGAKGHDTPTGVFTILQKKVDHESSIYKGAKMPHMQRLTWTGIAMHAGQLPGYPASHGCVRLPVDFAQKLYSVTSLGATVIVTDGSSTPGHSTNPGLLFSVKSDIPAGDALPVSGFEWNPDNAPKGPVSIIFSASVGRAYVYRNGVLIGRARFSARQRIEGSHVYSALATVDSDGRRNWLVNTSTGRGKAPNLKALAPGVLISPEFLAKAREIIAPGTTIILTDLPVSPQTQSGAGFGILTTSL